MWRNSDYDSKEMKEEKCIDKEGNNIVQKDSMGCSV